jgi:hypothetical protein
MNRESGPRSGSRGIKVASYPASNAGEETVSFVRFFIGVIPFIPFISISQRVTIISASESSASDRKVDARWRNSVSHAFTDRVSTRYLARRVPNLEDGIQGFTKTAAVSIGLLVLEQIKTNSLSVG